MKKILKKYWWILIIFLLLISFGRMYFLYQKGYRWADWSDYRDLSFWMILELLIVPITLAIFIFILDKFERKEERKLNLDNQRERLLQNYFDALTDLILNENLKESKPLDEVREIARIKTLTTLKRLDRVRKSALLEFLLETELIQGKSGSDPIISLKDANLKDTSLVAANLNYANLVSAQLQGAHLMIANLRGAKLFAAQLQGAHLEGAHMDGAILGFTKFEKAIMPDEKEYDPKIHTNEYLTGKKPDGD